MGPLRDCRCRAAEQALHRPGQVFLDDQSQFLPSTRPKHPPPLSSEVVLQYLARCLRGQQLPFLWISNTSSGQLDSQLGRGQCRLFDVDRIPPQLTSIFPQRHQVLCPRKANLRGGLYRRTRRPAFALPLLHQQSLCLYCRRRRWQDLPGTALPTLMRRYCRHPQTRAPRPRLTKYLNRSSVPSSTVSQHLYDLSNYQTLSADLSHSEIRYRQAAPHSERSRAPEQQPEARPRGLGMSPSILSPRRVPPHRKLLTWL